MKRFKPFYVPNEENTSDRQTFVREFSGRMTPARFAILAAYANRLTFDRHCGCSHDCCGCAYRQSATFGYQQNQVSFYITYYYNY